MYVFYHVATVNVLWVCNCCIAPRAFTIRKLEAPIKNLKMLSSCLSTLWQNRPWGRTSMENHRAWNHRENPAVNLHETFSFPVESWYYQTLTDKIASPQSGSFEPFCLSYLMTYSLIKMIGFFLTVPLISLTPFLSEIQILKRTVSSPPPTTLDLGSQNTSTPSSSSSSSTTTNAFTSDPLSVVCGQFECVLFRLITNESSSVPYSMNTNGLH